MHLTSNHFYLQHKNWDVFHANIYSYQHDCTVGDFVTSAWSEDKRQRYWVIPYGAGAAAKQGVTIGSNAVVGMSAVVWDVPDGYSRG